MTNSLPSRFSDSRAKPCTSASWKRLIKNGVIELFADKVEPARIPGINLPDLPVFLCIFCAAKRDIARSVAILGFENAQKILQGSG